MVIWLPKPRWCLSCLLRTRARNPGFQGRQIGSGTTIQWRLLTLFESTTPLTAELEEVLPALPGGTG